MRIYTVHVRPGGPPDDPDVLLVKEGFCWPALFVPLPWALYHRLWLGLLAYLAGAAVFGLAGQWLLQSGILGAVLGLAYGLIVAWSANDWRRWTIERAGYRQAGVVAAANLAEAERRLFSGWAHDPSERPFDVAPLFTAASVPAASGAGALDP